MTLVVTRSAPSGDLRDWPTWDAESVHIELADHVTDDQADGLVDQVGDALERVLRAAAGSVVLLTVEHPDLTGLPWERLAVGPQVVRYAPTLAARAYEPVEAALSIFFSDIDDADGRVGISSQYFRSVVASGQPGDRLETVVENGRFDVVHIGVHERSGRPGSGDSELHYGGGSRIDARAMARALDRTAARLLVLESRPSGGGAGSLTDSLRRLAHRVHEATGVAVLASGPADFGSFYFDLTHDLYLSDLVRVVRPSDPALDQMPALWLSRGGDSALRLLAASARLAADVVDEQQRVEAAHRAQPAAPEVPSGPAAAEAAVDVLHRLAQLRERTYSFDQETQGVVPMAESRAELDELQRVRADRIPEPTRVLNACMPFPPRPRW